MLYKQEEVFHRFIDEEEWEQEGITLCSTCLDEIWEFVFETEIDRSDKADPIPLQKVEDNVERHIDDLENIIEMLNDVDTAEKESNCRPLFPKRKES
jgi:hypothetical protein